MCIDNLEQAKTTLTVISNKIKKNFNLFHNGHHFSFILPTGIEFCIIIKLKNNIR